ncbi:polygalacturonase-like [Nicotiana tomentosiformis]|uniref:polygalacturonase-like n=1 Tax=Nicotiana tomentosiformis TaxID=4098 RepID=UPI00388C6D69
MENPIFSLLLISLLSIFLTEAIADVVTLNVINLGAKPDGQTDSTRALLTAWAAACGSLKPATIFVPQGKYLVKQAHFKGKCKNRAITFQIDGTLIAPSDYNVIGNSKNWIMFQGVDGVSIHGGILDGQGTSLWSCKASGKNCPSGANVSRKSFMLSVYFNLLKGALA